MNRTLAPPAGLPHDPGAGIFVALAVPWGEAIQPPHPDAQHVFHRGDVHQPRRPLEHVRVTVDHTGATVGMVVATCTDGRGVWASLKLGHVARRLVAAGHVGVSPEIADDGELVGVAVAYETPAGLPSARIVRPVVADHRLHDEPATPALVGPDAVTASRAPVDGPLDSSPRPHSAEPWGSVIWGTGATAPTEQQEHRGPSPGPVRPLATEDPEEAVERARRREQQRQAALAAAAAERDRDHGSAAVLPAADREAAARLAADVRQISVSARAASARAAARLEELKAQVAAARRTPEPEPEPEPEPVTAWWRRWRR